MENTNLNPELSNQSEDLNKTIFKTRKKKTTIKNESNNFITYIIWAIILTGFLAGVSYIYFGGEKSLDIINDWFDKIIQQKSDSNITDLFLSTFISSNIYILIIFLLGFSPIFSSIISCVPFLKGIGLGLSITYVFINYGWRGIVYESAINIPFNIFIISIIVLATRESIKFSNDIYNIIQNKTDTHVNIKRYFIKFIVILSMLAFLSFMNSVCDFIFFKYLNIL